MSQAAEHLSDHLRPLWHLGQRWAQCLAQRLSSLGGDAVVCELALWRLVSPEQVSTWCEPTCCFALGARCRKDDSLAGGAQLELSPSLAEALIDLVLGMQPRPLHRSRPVLTAVDRQLLMTVVRHACWAFNAARQEADSYLLEPADMLQPAPPMELIVCELLVRLNGCGGYLRLALPTAHRNLLLAETESSALANLEATLPPLTLGAGELAGLAEGDVLATDVKVSDEVLVQLEGQEAFAAVLGQYQGRRAVTITRKLAAP
jgi:flagellar motor switch protein FliM